MAFATEGCTRIAIYDRDTAGLAQTRALIEEKQREASGDRVEVEVITGNVASEESVAKMVQTVVQRWGRIDYAVNSAGIHLSASWPGKRAVWADFVGWHRNPRTSKTLDRV